MKFSIIIPVYNEEESIESIVERCLNVKEVIIKETYISDVEIIVVSDGSTDETVKIVEKFIPKIKLVSFLKNKGYGKAIKTGFENSDGDLVSFLDADGTYDPLYFIDMIKKIDEKDADICIGSRMGPKSKMPGIRRIGNKIFRFIINLIANAKISDAASGMRVIRKEKLIRVYPLPNGLNFTPAMSSRAVLDPDLKIVEVDITYEERQGESKLNIIRDGISFFKVIISIALTYRPLRILGSIGLFLVIISLFCGAATSMSYFKKGFISEGDIYKF